LRISAHFLDVREAGETCVKYHVAGIMKANKIQPLWGYKAPRSIVGRSFIITPNRLQRGFTVDHLDRAWVTDITYIRTWQGRVYLAVVMDLLAHEVVGWPMKSTLV